MEARERLILRRDTHIDQLMDKLGEPRVRRVIEPLLGGDEATYSKADFEYVLGTLGLVAPGPVLRNRESPSTARSSPGCSPRCCSMRCPSGGPSSYVDAGGGLKMDRLLSSFQDFFRRNPEHWIERAPLPGGSDRSWSCRHSCTGWCMPGGGSSGSMRWGAATHAARSRTGRRSRPRGHGPALRGPSGHHLAGALRKLRVWSRRPADRGPAASEDPAGRPMLPAARDPLRANGLPKTDISAWPRGDTSIRARYRILRDA